MPRIRRRALRREAENCLRQRRQNLGQSKLKDPAWPTHLNKEDENLCATGSVAYLAHAMGDDKTAGKVGRYVLSRIDGKGRIPCGFWRGYDGMEIIAQVLVLLSPLNIGQPEKLKLALEKLSDLVCVEEGTVMCNPDHLTGDTHRVIPVALELTVLARYREDPQQFAAQIESMRNFIRRQEDSDHPGAWNRTTKSSWPPAAVTTAMVLTALLCSGPCTVADVAKSVKYILKLQQKDGSWAEFEECIDTEDPGLPPVTLPYGTHQVIMRALCIAMPVVPGRLQRKIEKALFRQLRFLVDERRESSKPRPGDRQTALSPDAVAKLASELATIQDLVTLLFDRRNRYLAWRFEHWHPEKPDLLDSVDPRRSVRVALLLGSLPVVGAVVRFAANLLRFL